MGCELFSDKVHENATLYVRPMAVEAARTTYPWNKFKNIVAYEFPIQDYYLVGDFNDWENGEENCKFTPTDNGDYVFDYEGRYCRSSRLRTALGKMPVFMAARHCRLMK